MNAGLIVGVCCYAGDAHQVQHAMPLYQHHGCPVVVLSPKDSPVILEGCKNRQFGRRAYIGQETLDRQRWYLQSLLEFKGDYFLINDSDSFCLSPQIPARLFSECSYTIWSNEIVETRPHESPYPKLAFQPPYFLDRKSIEKILVVASRVTAHPITPYVDWWMNAVSCEAGLAHRPFTDLEHEGRCVFRATETDPSKACWQQLDYRIRQMGTVMMHPVKTPEQVKICTDAYEGREP